MNRIVGVRVATITTSSGGGIVLPSWFLACTTAAFFTATFAVCGVAASTWSQVQQISHQTQDNTARIEKLEGLQIDVATMKADISSIKDGQKSSNEKLDRLVDRAMQGH